MTTFECYACQTTASHRLHEVPKERLEDLIPFSHQNPPQISDRVERGFSVDAPLKLIPRMFNGRHGRIDRGPPLHTVGDLRRVLEREWNQIFQAFFMNLMESMRRRCLACIASNGGHTRYWAGSSCCDFWFAPQGAFPSILGMDFLLNLVLNTLLVCKNDFSLK